MPISESLFVCDVGCRSDGVEREETRERGGARENTKDRGERRSEGEGEKTQKEDGGMPQPARQSVSVAHTVQQQ